MMEVTEEEIQRLYDGVIEVVRLVIRDLYSLSFEKLQTQNPCIEDIRRMCVFFHDLVRGHDLHGEFAEAVLVIGEAAEAVIEGSEATLTDCAYHLEDFLNRVGR